MKKKRLTIYLVAFAYTSVEFEIEVDEEDSYDESHYSRIAKEQASGYPVEWIYESLEIEEIKEEITHEN